MPRRNIDGPRRKPLPALRLNDTRRAQAVEALGERGGKVFRHVLHDQGGGQSAGNPSRKSLIASVPPVEAPTKIRLPLPEVLADETGTYRLCRMAPPPQPALHASGGQRQPHAICRPVLPRTPSSRSGCPRGLPMKSMAPSSSARNVVSEPASVNADTITTRVGRKRIRRSGTRDRPSAASARRVSARRD